MKRIYKLQIVANKYCLQSYRTYLESLYATAKEGKDPNCTKCDENGFLKESDSAIFSGRKVSIPKICDCVKEEKSKIFRKIEALDSTIKTYNTIFGTLDNRMTLDIFANRFNQGEIVSSIKKYLDLGSSMSLYFEGESGAGKTTMLKMLWQIYAMNNIKVFYMKASHFEDLYKNLFNKNADKNIKTTIDKKIEYIKNADIVMIDDVDSIGFHYAVEGYYKIFDNIRTSEKIVLMTSNKKYQDLLNSLNTKGRKDNIDDIKGRITSRLLNLKIVEVEMCKSKVKVDTKNKELVLF